MIVDPSSILLFYMEDYYVESHSEVKRVQFMKVIFLTQ